MGKSKGLLKGGRREGVDFLRLEKGARRSYPYCGFLEGTDNFDDGRAQESWRRTEGEKMSHDSLPWRRSGRGKADFPWTKIHGLTLLAEDQKLGERRWR